MQTTNSKPTDTQSQNEKTATSHSEPSTPNLSWEEMARKIMFWPEILPYFTELKYIPYGSTSLEVPAFHCSNIKKAADEAVCADYQYSQMGGKLNLKESVINNFPEVKRFTAAGIKLTTKNVMISSGAVAGIGSYIEALCKPDDEIILFEPIYPFHMAKACLRDLTVKTVRLCHNPQKNQFELDFEALKKTLTPKSRLLIFSNPNNPTCKVFTKEEYQKLSKIIKDYPNLIVVDDMAYFLYYDDPYKPIPYAVVNPEDFKRTITVYSAGKMYNVTGLRLGISIGPEDLLTKTTNISPLLLQMVPSFEQLVIKDDLVSANQIYKNGRDFYEETRKDVANRAKLVQEALEKCDIQVTTYEGSYYMVLNVENWRNKLDEKYYKTLGNPEVRTPELDIAFCRMLFLEKKIGMFPLTPLYFGENPPDNFLRLSINRNDDELKFLIESCHSLLIKK